MKQRKVTDESIGGIHFCSMVIGDQVPVGQKDSLGLARCTGGIQDGRSRIVRQIGLGGTPRSR